jgi:hypothetical protein
MRLDDALVGIDLLLHAEPAVAGFPDAEEHVREHADRAREEGPEARGRARQERAASRRVGIPGRRDRPPPQRAEQQAARQADPEQGHDRRHRAPDCVRRPRREMTLHPLARWKGRCIKADHRVVEVLAR